MEETATDRNTDIRILAKKFLGNLTAHNYSAESVQDYGYVLKYFNDFIAARRKIKALDVTPQDIADYRLSLVKRKLKQNSLYVYLRAIRLFFKYLQEQDHVFLNPAVDMELPGMDRRLQPVPTEDEITLLLSLPDISTPIGMRDRSVLETLYSTAIRREEAAAVSLGDIDMAGSTLKVMGKGKQERIVPLGRKAMNWIKRYTMEARDALMNGNTKEPALWLNSQGKRLRGQQIHILVRTYARSCDDIKTHITTHSLRRACATHMLQNGASPFDIQLLLGHADLTHLKNYLRISISDLKAMHQRTRLGE